MDFVGDLKVNYGHFYFSVFADSATGRVGTIVSTVLIGGKCAFCYSKFRNSVSNKKMVSTQMSEEADVTR